MGKPYSHRIKYVIFLRHFSLPEFFSHFYREVFVWFCHGQRFLSILTSSIYIVSFCGIHCWFLCCFTLAMCARPASPFQMDLLFVFGGGGKEFCVCVCVCASVVHLEWLLYRIRYKSTNLYKMARSVGLNFHKTVHGTNLRYLKPQLSHLAHGRVTNWSLTLDALMMYRL